MGGRVFTSQALLKEGVQMSRALGGATEAARNRKRAKEVLGRCLLAFGFFRKTPLVV